MSTTLIYPVLALIGWTLVMWVWMYVKRIPAIQKAKIDLDELAKTGEKMVLPTHVTRVVDNYNHLHEQPTIFYALVLSAAFLGAADGVQIALAWTYVALRIAHSLVQATTYLVLVRFGLFVLGTLTLIGLFVRTVYLVV
jgi:hypothetical protein